MRPNARVVLWCAVGTSDSIWMIERFGTTLETRYGRRANKHRVHKTELAKDEASAVKTFDKAVAKKVRDGYKAPFTTDEAIAVVKERLGVVLDDLVVTEIVARAHALRPDDQIEQIMTPRGPVDVHVVEELAIATIDIPAGETVWLNYRRPSTGVWTGVQIEIG